jgi:hypothetical protein
MLCMYANLTVRVARGPRKGCNHCGDCEEVLACRRRTSQQRFRVRIFAERLRGSRQHVRNTVRDPVL